MSNILRNSLILDTETLGLERGAGIHELAFMDLETNRLRSFVLNPNAVTIQAAIPQEKTGLASSAADTYKAVSPSSWQDAIHQLVARQAPNVPAGQTMALLKEQQPWLYSQLKNYPHLVGKQDDLSSRVARFKSMGVTAELGIKTSIDNALSILKDTMSGKTVWIANTAFESKQIGAQLGTQGPIAWSGFKKGMETWNPDSPDPFYVTGTEVTKARALAGKTGDWTGVWRAYQDGAPAAGETAVRDIQDVTRALHSYGRKLGFVQKDVGYLGTGIDISQRLHAFAAGDTERMNMGEFHRAAEDVGIHESYVLRKNIRLVEALQSVAEGTSAGKALLAEGPDGILGEAGRYFSALEAYAPSLVREQAIKRLARAQTDILDQGATFQRTGSSTYMQSQLGPDGKFRSAYRQISSRQRMTGMDQVLGFLEAEGKYDQYGVSIRDEWQKMNAVRDSKAGLDNYVFEEVRNIQSTWKNVKPAGSAARVDRVIRNPRGVGLGVNLVENASSVMRGKAGLAIGAVAALAAAGALASVFQQPTPARTSMLSYGYDEWFEQQRIEGLSEGPIAKQQRHSMTDFGSPYRGPTGVQTVFADQELMAEREKWLRAQYGARHLSQGVRNPLQALTMGRTGYSYIPGGKKVRGEDYGMKGNLMAINLGKDGWKMSVEDADTVVLKRGGIQGAVASFFGLNKGYSFRLAGIDSTETSHGARSYHAPQPWAEEAKQALTLMMARSNDITMLFDPNQTTYGRQLGGIYADGRNINFQLVKRGLAAHLPFGKWKDSIIDYSALGKAEDKAYQANRGLWSQPWARSFYEQSKASGSRLTFNTLTNVEKIVQNSGTMQMITAMEQAQQDGSFTSGHVALAQQLGRSYNMGADSVGPRIMSAATTPSTSFLQEQLQDLAGFISTKGRGGPQNKFSSRSGYGSLDKSMAIDTISSNSIWTRSRPAAFGQYRSQKALNRVRKERMANQQRQALRKLNESPIGHARM